MRRLLCLSALAAPVASLCQVGTYAGTKADNVKSVPVAGPSGMGMMPFFQMLLALAIVYLALKLWLPKLISKFKKRIVPSAEGGIRIQESAAFAGGSLYIIEARGKSLLVCAAATGVTCLATLQDEPKPPPCFLDVLDEVQQGAAPPEISGADSTPPDDSILDNVDRIIRGTGRAVSEPIHHALVSDEAIPTRLPPITEPLQPTEPKPWRPRMLEPEDREAEMEAVLRRLQRLSQEDR